MILDVTLLVLSIIAITIGYNRGALATLFSLIGYLGGGVVGFAAANWYTVDWKDLTSIIFLHLFGIFAGANLGKFILEKSGIVIHSKILFGPFKLLNSILGALIFFTQFAILIIAVLTIALQLPFEIIQFVTEGSQVLEKIKVTFT